MVVDSLSFTSNPRLRFSVDALLGAHGIAASVDYGQISLCSRFCVWSPVELPLRSAFQQSPLSVLRLLGSIYGPSPLSLSAIYALESNRARNSAINVMTAFITAAVCGFTLYHFYPVAGPIYAFKGTFPSNILPLDSIGIMPMLVPPVYRNCFPSLHFAWSLSSMVAFTFAFVMDSTRYSRVVDMLRCWPR